ncbi:hypothetical protein BGZ63DRAFT_506240 [Mariannaea sp. PMI_226]|nr:hypothetical protein BGZ63DRAFT_506240 [Mariannaea sp. PMI_226]
MSEQQTGESISNSNGHVQDHAPPPQASAARPDSGPTDEDHSHSNNATRLGNDLKDRIKSAAKGPPGGFDDTPLPDAPPGYTIRIIFHGASNLPAADFSTASSDPYIHATLKGTQPTRHKEDPDLVHRTRTARRTTEPEWEEEWVVANVPPTGFTLKCRLYDEDYPDSDDRLGNVTIKVPELNDRSQLFPAPGKEFHAKKRMGSKRAYLVKGVTSLLTSESITPRVRISMEVLGKSDPPHAQMYTVGPTTWVKHYSPLIGRITGTKVNANADDDVQEGDDKTDSDDASSKKKKKNQKYDFQAIEMQLAGPVPPILYHRFVEFRPIIGSMYNSTGLRGKILNKALHRQHRRVYNFDKSTEWGSFPARTEEAALQFLKLTHFNEGARTYTYVLTLDGMFRFTETGKEFGIDMLSKHTMHSDVATYIACSGEFFIHKRKHHHHQHSSSLNPNPSLHSNPSFPPMEEISSAMESQTLDSSQTTHNPADYTLYIDNDSGTYRPDKCVLPQLQEFLEANFPSLNIVTNHWEDETLQEMKQAQRTLKKQQGRMINMVMNRSQSSISSAESELDDREEVWEEQGHKSKREAAYEVIEDPSKMKDALKAIVPGMH